MSNNVLTCSSQHMVYHRIFVHYWCCHSFILVPLFSLRTSWNHGDVLFLIWIFTRPLLSFPWNRTHGQVDDGTPASVRRAERGPAEEPLPRTVHGRRVQPRREPDERRDRQVHPRLAGPQVCHSVELLARVLPPRPLVHHGPWLRVRAHTGLLQAHWNEDWWVCFHFCEPLARVWWFINSFLQPLIVKKKTLLHDQSLHSMAISCVVNCELTILYNHNS